MSSQEDRSKKLNEGGQGVKKAGRWVVGWQQLRMMNDGLYLILQEEQHEWWKSSKRLEIALARVRQVIYSCCSTLAYSIFLPVYGKGKAFY